MPTLKELRAFCKTSNRDGLTGRLFTRPFAIYFTWIFANLGWNAEKVCFLWVLMGSVSGFFYMFGHYYLALIGLSLYHIAMILDCTDGDIARYTKKCTLRGPYLDLIGHHLMNPLLLFGAGIYAYKNPMFGISPLVFLIAGAVAAIFTININLAGLKVFEVFADNNLPVAKERERMKKVPTYSWKVFLREQLRIAPGSLLYWATILKFLPAFILFEAVLMPLYYLYRAFKEFKYLEHNFDRKA